jgi:hypothetical protein
MVDTTTIRTMNIGPGTKLVAHLSPGAVLSEASTAAGSKRAREDVEPNKETWAALSEWAREESRARWFIEKARKDLQIYELFLKSAESDAERAESILRDFPHIEVKP